MLNYEEELKKYKPSLEVDQTETTIYENDLTDISDILEQILKNRPENGDYRQ